MHLVNRKSLSIAVAALCGAALVTSLTGCSHDDGDLGPAAPKLGTDTQPPAKNQGDAPGMIGKDGGPVSPGGGLPLPGNKGKHFTPGG